MKDLHIDLILPTERRSASPISLKLIGRIVVVVVVVLAVGTMVAGVQKVKSDLARIEAELAPAKASQAKADALIKKLGDFTAMQEEVKSWSVGRVDWPGRLKAIREIVPADIQLNVLGVNDRIGTAAWVGDMEVRGRGEGEDPKKDVDDLVNGFKKCTNFVESAKVMDFKADPDRPKHRLFSAVVTLKPQYFAEKKSENIRKK